MRSSLLCLYRDNTHPARLSSPFWTGGRGSSPMGPLSSHSTWSPRNTGTTFTSWNFWRKWWSLCKPRTLRPGFVPVSPKCLRQGLHCCRRWRERHIQRAVELFLSLGTKGRGLSFSQKCGRMSGAAGDGGHLSSTLKGTVPSHWWARSKLDYPNHPKPILLWFLYY